MKRSMKIILSSAIILSFIVTSLGLAAIPVKSIKTNTSVKMQMGNTFMLKVAFTPANATNRKVTFSSADESIATVSSTGYIKGIKAGKTVVTVTSVSNNKAVAKCNITILSYFPLKKQITLTVFTGLGTNYMHDFKNLGNSPIYKEYLKLTNIKFKFENVDPNIFQLAVQTKIATGDLPDITELVIPQSLLTKVVEAGKILKLDEYYKKYTPDIWKNINDNKVAKASISEPNGNIYKISNTLEYSYIGRTFIWNVDAVKKAGYDPNSKITYEDFYQILKWMKANGITSPWLPDYRANSNIFGLDFTNNGFYAENGIVKSNFANPHFKEYLVWLNKLYKEGLIPVDFDITLNNTEAFYNLINKNTVGVISKSSGWGYGFNPSIIASGVIKENDDAIWLSAPPIQGPYGDRFYYIAPNYSKSNWVISSASKYKAEAFNWLMYISNDPKMQNINYYGIEGLTFKTVDGKSGHIMTAKDYMTAGIQFPWPVFDSKEVFNNKQPRVPKSQDQYASNYLNLMYKKEYQKPQSANITLTDEETNERDRYLNDFNTYCNENSLKFIKGERTLNEFDEFVKGLNNAGLDKLLIVYQSMYDRYLKLSK